MIASRSAVLVAGGVPLLLGCGDQAATAGLDAGDLIAFSDPRGISVIAPEGSGEMVVVEHEATAPSWSPDGERIQYFEYGESGMFVIEAADLRVSRLTQLGSWFAVPAAWSPDGSYVAAGAGEGLLIASADGEDADLFPRSRVSAPSWTHDGAGLVLSGADGIVRVGLDGDETGILDIDDVFGNAVASRQHDRVAFARDADGCTIEVVGLDGSGRTVVANDPDAECRCSPVWSPVDPVVAFCTGTPDELRLWNTGAPGAGQRLLDEQPAGRPWGVDYSPNGEFIVYAHDFDDDAYASEDSVIVVVDVAAALATELTTGTSPSWRTGPH